VWACLPDVAPKQKQNVCRAADCQSGKEHLLADVNVFGLQVRRSLLRESWEAVRPCVLQEALQEALVLVIRALRLHHRACNATFAVCQAHSSAGDSLVQEQRSFVARLRISL
jgi:hypothetical protein